MSHKSLLNVKNVTYFNDSKRKPSFVVIKWQNVYKPIGIQNCFKEII